jgi:hypothetical protein
MIFSIRRARVSGVLASSTWRTYSLRLEKARASKRSVVPAVPRATARSSGMSVVRGKEEGDAGRSLLRYPRQRRGA